VSVVGHMRVSSIVRALILGLSVGVVLLGARALPARAANGPQYGSIGPYGEAWRGGGFDACWFDNGLYDGDGFTHGVAGCTANETQPAPGQFVDPVGFTVDTQDATAPDDTAIYVLDRTSNLPADSGSGSPVGTTTWRLQKLDDTGQVLGADEFSLPDQAAGANSPNNGIFNYEVLGLAVDPTEGAVYALVTAYDDNQIVNLPYDFTNDNGYTGIEYVEEVLAWSTAPNASKQMVAPPCPDHATGVLTCPDKLSIGIDGYPTPGALSTPAELSHNSHSGAPEAPESGGIPEIIQPEGLALDVTGGSDYLAVESADDTGTLAAQAGIAQVCASASCSPCPSNIAQYSWLTCADSSATYGDIRLQWSASQLDTDTSGAAGESDLAPDGISTVPAGSSTATPGSLTVLLNEEEDFTGGASTFPTPSDIDVNEVPADLTSAPVNQSYNAITVASLSGTDADDADIDTSDNDVELQGGDSDSILSGSSSPTADAIVASPQVVPLSNGLYAGDFEPDPAGSTDDPQAPANQPQPGLWTSADPAVRLLEPLADGTLSNDPSITNNPPLATLFDTLGNPTTNVTGTTDAASACNLSDAVSNGQTATYPSLAAGSNGALWVLTRGFDSSTWPLFHFGSESRYEGGRYLIELAPVQEQPSAEPCPGPSGTFTVTPSGDTVAQAATSPVDVRVGTPVAFDACPPATTTDPVCPPTAPAGTPDLGISSLGAATAQYTWDFGDGTSQTVDSQTDPDTGYYLWPDPTITHTFTSASPEGDTVTLTVQGDFGTYVETGTVDVGTGSLPTASFTDSQSSSQPLTVNFDASASTPTSGNNILNYHWDWGDGQIDDTSSPTDTHTFPSAGTYTVTLSVLDSAYAHSPPGSEAVTVVAPPPPPPAGPTPEVTTTGTASTPPPPGPPAVVARVESKTAVHGRVLLLLTCPTGQISCAGSVELKTTRPVAVEATSKNGKEKREPRRVLVLGSASFKITGAETSLIGVRLSAEALTLLSKSRGVRAIALITATNPGGKRHLTSVLLTVRPATKR
jgi:hypothetical protein